MDEPETNGAAATDADQRPPSEPVSHDSRAEVAQHLEAMARRTGDPWWRVVAADVLGQPNTENLLRAFVHPARPEIRYPGQAQYVARQYLAARRGLWTFGVVWALTTLGLFGAVLYEVRLALHDTLVTVSASMLFTVTAVQFGMHLTRAADYKLWLRWLRSLMGYPPLPSDISTLQYARAVADGSHPVGEVERALVALWQGESTGPSRQVLSRRGLPDPSDPGLDFARVPRGRFPMWHRGGEPWHQAPAPEPDHDCTPWTIAVLDPGTEKACVAFRCACGAVRFEDRTWLHRNERIRSTATPPATGDSR